MFVKDVMHTNAMACQSSDSLEKVASLMWTQDCGAVPIMDESHNLIGMVTDRDISMAAALQHRPLWEISAGEILSGQNLLTCSPDEDVHSVLQRMGTHRTRRVPVIDSSNQLKGMLSLKDVVESVKVKPASAKGKSITADETVSLIKEISKSNSMHVAA